MSPAESLTITTYHTAGGRHGGSRVRLPRKEGARSRHQCLFEENVKKTETCGLRTLSVKGSGVVFTHGEGVSIPCIRHKGRRPLIKCAISCLQFVLFSLFYVFMFFMGVLYFLSFYGRQKRGFCSYAPSIKEEIRPT